MPHVTIEYSGNVADEHDADALVRAVHDAGLAHGLAPADGLRTRAVARHHYRIADGHPDHAFVALTARVGPGRTTADKVSFLTALLDAAEATLSGEGDRLAIAYSAEIQEIDPELRINRNHVRARLQAQGDGGAGRDERAGR